MIIQMKHEHFLLDAVKLHQLQSLLKECLPVSVNAFIQVLCN